MRCRFIQAEKANHTVRLLCDVMQVARSTYYAVTTRKPSKRRREDDELKPLIRRIHLDSKRRYGAPRIHRALRHHDVRVGRKRVARLMLEQDLMSISRRKYRCTTDSSHGLKTAANVLDRAFEQDCPDRVWVGDITYLWTTGGWLYLAVLIDLASRRVVGWAMANHMRQELTQSCLMMALQQRQPAVGWMHHTDQGSQYAAGDYRALVEAWGGQLSMSRRGDCWDNAVAESFFATLKKELTHAKRFETREQASLAVLDYIRWYNAERIHSALDYETPIQYEEKVNRAASARAA